jgi:hypothetical protein
MSNVRGGVSLDNVTRTLQGRDESLLYIIVKLYVIVV